MRDEQQDSKASYLKWTLRIKQYEVNEEITRFAGSKEKLGDFKNEVLQDVQVAQAALSNTQARVKTMSEDKEGDIISEEMRQQLDEALTLKSVKVEAIFQQREDKMDAEKRSFEKKMASEEQQIRASIEKMDKEVQLLTPMQPKKFIYKKLDLFGSKSYGDNYFESISEEKFNSIKDKNSLKLESLLLQKQEGTLNLGRLETKLSNGDLFKHHSQSLDSKSFTFDLKNFMVDQIEF